MWKFWDYWNTLRTMNQPTSERVIWTDFNEEKSTKNAIHLITKVNQIMHDVDNTIHVTHAYRIGQTNNKSKQRPIIACLETETLKYAAVKQAYRLKRSTKFQNAFISEDLCHNFKISRQEQLSKHKEMKQQYRYVCFRGTELIEKNKNSQWLNQTLQTILQQLPSLLSPLSLWLTSANPRILIDNWSPAHPLSVLYP